MNKKYYRPVCYLRREWALRKAGQPLVSLYPLRLPPPASLRPQRKRQFVASFEELKAVENDGRVRARGCSAYEWLER